MENVSISFSGRSGGGVGTSLGGKLPRGHGFESRPDFRSSILVLSVWGMGFGCKKYNSDGWNKPNDNTAFLQIFVRTKNTGSSVGTGLFLLIITQLQKEWTHMGKPNPCPIQSGSSVGRATPLIRGVSQVRILSWLQIIKEVSNAL